MWSVSLNWFLKLTTPEYVEGAKKITQTMKSFTAALWSKESE